MANDDLEFEQISKNLESEDKQSRQEQRQVINAPVSYGTLPLSNKSLRDKALKAVTSRLQNVKADHDNRVKNWDKWESIYKNARLIENKTTLAQVNCAQAFNVVEDWTASIVDTVFGVNPPLQVEGKDYQLSPDTLGKIENVLWQKAGLDCDIENEVEIGSRDAVKTGMFVFKKHYQLDEKPTLEVIEEPVAMQTQGMALSTDQVQKRMQEGIKIEDHPILKALDIRKLYFRPDHITWVIEKIDTNWSVVKKQAQQFGVYGNLEAAETSEKPQDDDTQESKADANTEDTQEAENIDGDVELLEAHHVPMTLTAKDFGEDQELVSKYAGKRVLYIITVANQTEVIRVQPTPYRELPYIIVPFIPQRGTVYGIGILQIIEHLVVEFNTRRNQSLDANTLGLYCMVAINTKFLKKGQQLKKRPDGVIEFKGGDRPLSDMLQFLRPPTEYVTANFGILDRLENEIKTSSRLKGVLSGERVSPTVSATEMASIMKEALKSLKLIYRRIDREVMSKYFEDAYVMMVLNRQTSWQIAVQEAGMKDKRWVEVTPQDIYSNGISVRMLGVAHMEDELVMQQKNMQMLDLAGKFVPSPVPNENGELVIFNRYKAMNEILYMLGKDRPEDWWIKMPAPSPAPVMPGAGPGIAPRAPVTPGINNQVETDADLLNQALSGGV